MSEQPSERNTVLLIDDDEDVLKVTAMFLKSEGYVASTATTGADGIQMATTAQPHLIVCDLTMPGMDGYEVLAQLKNTPETQAIPVIMLTGKGDDAVILKVQELHAADFMIKPFEPEDLLAVIQKHIE
jgi:CheY-like chemotaxis protein